MKIEQLILEPAYRTSRSSGAGGQHVNKVETKVELRFDVPNSLALEETEKTWVLERLASRITKDGILILTNQESRSQSANKEAVFAEFLRLMEAATRPPKKRKKLKPLSADPASRLAGKRQQSEKKALRQKVTSHREVAFPAF